MLEKPDLADEPILARLNAEYGLCASRLTFLPIGADVNTAVFRVDTSDEKAFFLKLRKGSFNEITVTVPQYLHNQGIPEIITPLVTRKGLPWLRYEDFVLVLYPFIVGKNGYQVALSDQQWLDFGAVLKAIHGVRLPTVIAGQIPLETYSPRWREIVRTFQTLIIVTRFKDPTAVKLAEFMLSRQEVINHMLARTDQLGRTLQTRPLDTVLCHADIHAGNLFLSDKDALYIVDWDNPTYAPKERDLALIGGSGAWNRARETALFFQGYGQTQVDREALAYFRYERIIQDIAAYGEQLLLTEAGGEDREQSLTYFMRTFSPDNEVDLALKFDK